MRRFTLACLAAIATIASGPTAAADDLPTGEGHPSTLWKPITFQRLLTANSYSSFNGLATFYAGEVVPHGQMLTLGDPLAPMTSASCTSNPAGGADIVLCGVPGQQGVAAGYVDKTWLIVPQNVVSEAWSIQSTATDGPRLCMAEYGDGLAIADTTCIEPHGVSETSVGSGVWAGSTFGLGIKTPGGAPTGTMTFNLYAGNENWATTTRSYVAGVASAPAIALGTSAGVGLALGNATGSVSLTGSGYSVSSSGTALLASVVSTSGVLSGGSAVADTWLTGTADIGDIGVHTVNLGLGQGAGGVQVASTANGLGGFGPHTTSIAYSPALDIAYIGDGSSSVTGVFSSLTAPAATTSVAGLMSAADKTSLNALSGFRLATTAWIGPFQNSGTIANLSTSKRAYFCYLGYTVRAITIDYVRGLVGTGGAGAQTAEIGLFSTPLPPSFTTQTVSKIWATDVLDDLTGTGLLGNSVAAGQVVPAGVHLWAGVRGDMGTTQVTWTVTSNDKGVGTLLYTGNAAALTTAGPWSTLMYWVTAASNPALFAFLH